MNYILFFPDELRAETIGCYGHPTIRTPNFDRLAREGTLFEQCHVQNPVCSPSRCCLSTGEYVHVNGHRTLWNLIKPYEKNLFRYLKENGYEVRVYGKNDLFSQEAIPLCTDEFLSRPGMGVEAGTPIPPYPEQGCYRFLYSPLPGDWRDSGDYQNVAAGMEFLRKRKPGDKPFFLFLPLSFPHCPYTVHEPFYSMYREEDIFPLRPEGTGKPAFQALIRKNRDLNQEILRKIQAVYMGMVSFTDALLGELMDCLEETGLSQNTMLIAASDHGDYAGDYGLVEKWPSGLDDVLTHVPLIIRGPGCQAGHRSREITELFDIMPTVLESAGIPVEHTHFARSLLPQLAGERGDPDRAAFCEGGYNFNEPHCNEGNPRNDGISPLDPTKIYYPKRLQQKTNPETVGRAVMIRTLEYKLVKRSYGGNELYDLEKDPQELVNRYEDKEYLQIRQELERRLLDWYLNTSDVVPFEEDSRV